MTECLLVTGDGALVRQQSSVERPQRDVEQALMASIKSELEPMVPSPLKVPLKSLSFLAQFSPSSLSFLSCLSRLSHLSHLSRVSQGYEFDDARLKALIRCAFDSPFWIACRFVHTTAFQR